VSFLVASGHVQVDANTRGAKDEIQDLIRAMGGISPSAQAAADALKDLGKRAGLSGQALGKLGERARDAERALAGLRAVAGDIRITADLDDRTTAGVNAVKAAIQDLKDQGPVRIDVTFDGDTAQLAATAQAMRDLKDNARDAGQAIGGLALRAAVAAAALNELENAARDASRALRSLRGSAAAAADAMRDLRDATSRASLSLRTMSNRADAVDGRFNTLADRTRALRRDMDDLDGSVRRVGGSFGALRPRLGGVTSSASNTGGAMQGLKTAALLLAPALIPLAAATVPIIAGTTAAAVGIAVFGLALGAQVKKMADAAEAQQKYDKAVEEHGRGSAEAAKAQNEMASAYKKLPPATREAAAAFRVFKDDYKSWSDGLAADTMPVVTQSMAAFGALLPRLSPLVRGTSEQLQRLVAVAAGGIQSAGFERFMDKLAGWASGALARATLGLVEFSQALDAGEVNSNVDEFMDYVRANGPVVAETLGNLAEASINLVVAASDMGVSILTVVNAFAKLFNALPESVVSTVLQLYAGMKLLKIGMAGVAAVASSAAVANITAFVRAARFGGVGPAIAGVAQRMTTLQKVGGSLAVLGVVAFAIDELAQKARGAPPDVDMLSDSLKTLSTSGKWSGELKATFGDMDGFVAKVGQLKTESAGLERAKPFLAFSGLGAFADTAVTKLDDLTRGTKSLGATKDDLKAFDASFAQLAKSGNADVAAEEFKRFTVALRGAGYSTKEINKLFPQYQSAVAGLKAEQELAARGMGLFGQQAIDTKAKLDAQKQSADGLRQSIQALNDVNRASLGGMIGFEAAIDAAAKAAKENAGSLRMVNGELDVNSPKAQAAAAALADLGAKTDAATAAAREGGASWERVNGIYSRGRDQLVKYAQQMGLSKAEAGRLADSILKIPDKHSTQVEMKREDALAGLDAVIAKIKATPGAKSVTVKTLSQSAIAALEAVGLKVKRLPDGSVTVTTRNGQALSAIGAVQAARNRLSDKSITITTFYTYKGKNIAGVSAGRLATGGRVKGYADGGNIQGFPEGGYISGPGSGTSDSILALMGSGAAAMVSNTEYVMRAAAVAKYGVGFMDAVNTGRLRLPGFAKGGKLTAKQKAAAEKQKQAVAAEKARQKEGKSALASDVTFTPAGKLAEYKNTETVHDLGMPDSVGSLVTSVNTYLSNIKKAFSGKTEKNLVSKMTSSGKALLDNQKKLEGVNKALDSAKSTLEDLKGKFDSLKTSVSSSLVGFANITKIGKYGTSADTLIKQLRSDTGRTTEFAKQLEQLKGKGLNAQSISEIAQAGVTGGGMSTARSLLNATPAQIAEINALEAQLKLSADKAGTVTADAMYGAGIRSAEGLVKGLTSQQDKIEAAMMKIAKSMEAAIKKALGIKSPAKRLEPIGDFSAQGVEVGWEKRLAKGRTLLSGSAAGLRLKPAVIGAGGSAGPATSSAPVVNLTATFNTMTLPSPSERKTFAQAMAKDINDALLEYQEQRRR
jgi:methyl-accepting chemotaxis protein